MKKMPWGVTQATPHTASKRLMCGISGCTSSYIHRSNMHRHMVLKHCLTSSGTRASSARMDAAKRNSSHVRQHSTASPALSAATLYAAPVAIDHVRKLVLVEPEMLEALMEYNTDSKRKLDTIELHNILDENETTDDVEAKLYQQTFRRFRNLPMINKSLANPHTTPLARRRGQQQPPTPVTVQRRHQQMPAERSNRSSRNTQQWSPY